MIFVTVGTHEQQFNRLVEYVDHLKADGRIQEDVIIQTGFSTYEPRHCQWQKLYPYPEMVQLVEQARIVITHGGPSSFIMPLQVGKIPVVVPRQKQFDEHVNNHQLEFCREVDARQKNIILVEDVHMLESVLSGYDTLAEKMNAAQNSNNRKFCEAFGQLADALVNNSSRQKIGV